MGIFVADIVQWVLSMIWTKRGQATKDGEKIDVDPNSSQFGQRLGACHLEALLATSHLVRGDTHHLSGRLVAAG